MSEAWAAHSRGLGGAACAGVDASPPSVLLELIRDKVGGMRHEIFHLCRKGGVSKSTPREEKMANVFAKKVSECLKLRQVL